MTHAERCADIANTLVRGNVWHYATLRRHHPVPTLSPCTCGVCGTVFAPNRPTTRYCSAECKLRAVRRNELKRKRAAR